MDTDYEVTRIIPKSYNPNGVPNLEATETNTDPSQTNPDRE